MTRMAQTERVIALLPRDGAWVRADKIYTEGERHGMSRSTISAGIQRGINKHLVECNRLSHRNVSYRIAPENLLPFRRFDTAPAEFPAGSGDLWKILVEDARWLSLNARDAWAEANGKPAPKGSKAFFEDRLNRTLTTLWRTLALSILGAAQLHGSKSEKRVREAIENTVRYLLEPELEEVAVLAFRFPELTKPIVSDRILGSQREYARLYQKAIAPRVRSP